MKILLVQETDWFERGPLQQTHLMERLSIRSHQIKIIDYEILWRINNKSGLYSKRIVFNKTKRLYEGACVDVIRPGIIKIPNLDYVSLLYTRWNEINRQIKEFRPDIILGFFILNAYLGMKAAKKSKIPFVYYWIDVYHTQIPFKGFHVIGKRIEQKVLKNADKVVAINDQLKDYVISLGSKPDKTHVIKGGVDSKQFSFNNFKRDKLRNIYKFKEDDIVLFFVGQLYHFSGLKEVVMQFINVDNNLKFLIVGNGEAYEDLMEIKKRYNLHDKIILTGKKPYHEVPDFIAAADICLLPAYPWAPIMQEIVPIKFYEYMALAKPVISTNLPGVRKEFGEDNGVVYVERPEDVVPKAVALVKSGQLAELGQKARRFVEQNSWDKITDEFEALLQEVISEKRLTAGRKAGAGI